MTEFNVTYTIRNTYNDQVIEETDVITCDAEADVLTEIACCWEFPRFRDLQIVSCEEVGA